MSARITEALRACRTFVISCRAEARGRNASRYEHAGELLETIDAALSTEPGEAEGYSLSNAQIVPVWAAMLAMVDDIHSGQDSLNDDQWRIARQICSDLTAMLDAAAPVPEDTHHGR